MNPQDWTIYATRLPHQQLTYESVYTTIPLVVGTPLGGVLNDATGENISHLNPYYCELTGVYWVCRNTDHPWVGNAHYRRKWNEEDVRSSEDGVLYVSDACRFPHTLKRQFLEGHGFDAISITQEMARRKQIPLTEAQLEATWGGTVFHGCLMARGPQSYYRQFMDVLFACIDPIWADYGAQIRSMDGYNRRMIGFIAERMMTALILHAADFFPFPVRQSRVEFHPR